MLSSKKRSSLQSAISDAEKRVKKVKGIEKNEPTQGYAKEVFDKIKKNFVVK